MSANTTFVFDVTAVIQEIINRGGWVSNNNLRLGWIDTGGSGTRYRYIEDYHAAGTAEAVLDITYTAGGGGATTIPRLTTMGAG